LSFNRILIKDFNFSHHDFLVHSNRDQIEKGSSNILARLYEACL